MKSRSNRDSSVAELVDQFAGICVAQGKALTASEHATFRRLFEEMTAIANELKAREGDQRRALMQLRAYNNMQVRLQAAKHLLAVVPNDARHQLELIANSNWFPQAGDAGMCLSALERGIFKPT